MNNENKPYNPLDYENLTINLVRELMTRGPFPLPPKDTFAGPGVYALFYTGDLELYRPIASLDAKQPIYVGKAVPRGARKGGSAEEESRPLFSRLREHSKSISGADNLSLEHFVCRYLVVVPLWITMAERFLIEHYAPVWNVSLDGFGNHDPGSGRHAGQMSPWDVVHPGRPWAKKLQKGRPDAELVEMLSRHWNAKKK